jgi:hypothetical protein
MTTQKTTTPTLRRLLQGGILALALTVTSGAAIAPAFADEWRHDRDAVREHDGRAHEARERHDIDHRYRWYAPGYAYNYRYVAPAYVPAPAYSAPVPLFNFGFVFR